MLAEAGLNFHVPGDILEGIVLGAITVASFMLGARALGRGYGAVSAALGLFAFVIVGNVAIPAGIALVAALLVARERITGERLHRPSIGFAREVAFVLGGLGVYTFGRILAEGDLHLALANTDRIIEFERGLGLYVEDDIQQWFLRHDLMMRTQNWIYSFAFLAAGGAMMLWLWAVDPANYRLFRNSLGISAVLAVITMALFPAAPPRLASDSGLIDSIAVFGREHAFTNEYAAVPSLHVGWMALAGLALGRSIGGRRGFIIALVPGTVMLVNVMATGNHFWWDGVVGVTLALGTAAGLLWIEDGGPARAAARARSVASAAGRASLLTWNTLGDNRKALFSLVTLSGLLAYLLIAQLLTPGFTDYWGYLTGQVFVFLVLLVAAEVVFAREGGLSWITHVIAVTCAIADVMGTDGDLYARIDEYDKLTHFAGIAALTAGIYDSLRCMYRRGWVAWAPTDRAMLSIAVGIALGIGWEVYELIGDRIFNTTRVGGRWDTGNDIFSDSLGAVMVVALLLWIELREPATAAELEWDAIADPAAELPAPAGER